MNCVEVEKQWIRHEPNVWWTLLENCKRINILSLVISIPGGADCGCNEYNRIKINSMWHIWKGDYFSIVEHCWAWCLICHHYCHQCAIQYRSINISIVMCINDKYIVWNDEWRGKKSNIWLAFILVWCCVIWILYCVCFSSSPLFWMRDYWLMESQYNFLRFNHFSLEPANQMVFNYRFSIFHLLPAHKSHNHAI